MIRLFEKLGWASNVKVPKPEQIEAKRAGTAPAPAAAPGEARRPRPRSASSWSRRPLLAAVRERPAPRGVRG